MSEKIKLVRNDTAPAIVVTIRDEVTGSTINISGASARLYFRQLGAQELQATVIGTLLDPENGVCAFYPSANPDMLSGPAGDYQGEVEITYADGTIQTVYTLLKFKVREDF
jgi:hypothetical protein